MNWQSDNNLEKKEGKQEYKAVVFLWDSDYDFSVRKFRTRDSYSDSGTKKSCTPTPTLGLIVWHNDCVLKDDWREILKFF